MGTEKKELNDNVNHPAHYCKGGIECIDSIKASMTDECFKYDFVTWCVPLPFYMRCGNNIIDKKNCWKLWRVFHTGKWHCAYGDAEYY